MAPGLLPLVSFIAVIAMIPVALWLLKRTPIGGAGTHGLLRTVAALPVSPSQRIVVVEVGFGETRQWLVLGITAQQIATLHVMPPQADAPTAPADLATTPFGQLMGRLRQQQHGKGEPHP